MIKDYERKLISALLELAADQFDNHGCNDFPIEQYLTSQQIQKLTKRYHEWNGNPEEYDPKYPISSDSALMRYFADQIYPERESDGRNE